MEQSGRPVGPRRGPRPPGGSDQRQPADQRRPDQRRTERPSQPNGHPRPAPGTTPPGAEGFENGWFGKPPDVGGPPTGRPRPPVAPPVNGFPKPSANGHTNGRAPVNGVARTPPDPAPPTEAGFDPDRFAAGMTDPGPFGRLQFETHPAIHVPEHRTPMDDGADPPHDLPPDDYVDEDEPGEPAEPAKARRKLPFWIELPILVVVALVLTFVIQTFVARVYVIPSGSMEQTLNGNNGSGDRILVDKFVYDFHDPRPGDVIVFKGPAGWDQTEYYVNSSGNPVTHWLHQIASSIGIAKPDEYDLVKRVVAVGGQTVACCDDQNRITVNGKALDEPYVYWEPDRGGPAQQLRFAPVTVPSGYLWVMGDNRNNSDDSRYQNGGGIHGIVPVSNVIGKARTIIWPPSRWRGIGDHNPQGMASAAAAPSWFGSVPATGVGVLAGLPTLWFGRRFGTKLGAAAGIPARPKRRRRG
ncbi:MAG TPA: signal peptidase I [Pseudonocardiaceae bacterium]|nr:signal peptidase I [Pseudonocardiaceae bacterium]